MMLVLILLWFVSLDMSYSNLFPDIHYQSPTLRQLDLRKQPENSQIRDDRGQTVTVEAYEDNKGLRYWYRRLVTDVCLTGECKPIDIGIYWSGMGQYIGLEVYREGLTKTDHSVFTLSDYRKLEKALSNEWSPLREYAFDELLEEGRSDLDATTGATRKVIADESVTDAAYTTYTIWHLVNVGENEQLALLTYQQLAVSKPLLNTMIHETNQWPAYQKFVLQGLLSAHITYSRDLSKLILHGMADTSDYSLRNLAYKVLNFIPFDDLCVQKELRSIYQAGSQTEKTQLLTWITNAKLLVDDLYDVLVADLEGGNPWFLATLIKAIDKEGRKHGEMTVRNIEMLADSENKILREAIAAFLKKIK